ncbi:hypothetical protein FJU31_12400 [Stenotrophomonas cyclobalanopsidis]|uniref:Uncharacterized protein n=1 Tax=Stenotrophomonas cyclobalanopsidis TaxID=2771362 RepID=A0ABQ6SZ91_9GAMM|nr:hypothetical protein [Stenotrophomonas cyclobalanopsidis]KAA8996764.1 hypothetical protein FJU31_12400 [Stenotrophomonas cyclobalanopsidis]
MDVAACRKKLVRWMSGAMLALVMSFSATAQAPSPTSEPVAEVAAATEEATCRACTYERIGRKVDIGLVALMATLIIGVLFAVSREWGTPSQRWTCRSTALFLAAMGLVFVWRAGSVLYLGYSPWQEVPSLVTAGWVDGLLTTSPRWLMALLLIAAAPLIWKRSEQLPRWRIA